MDHPAQTTRLSEGFTMKDLLADGANFALMDPPPSNMEEAECANADQAFASETHLSLFRPDLLDIDGDKYKTPFEYLHSVMDNVTSDGSVKKRIKRSGADVIVPSQAFVTFHLNSYVDLQDDPFDSSVISGKPYRKKLNSGSLLPGLEQALLSMRRHEKAEFLVNPRWAYGQLGCPPRIPPNAEILYEVELLDWTISPDSELIDNIDSLELEGSCWEKAKSNASKLHYEGNDWVKNQKFLKALKAYKGALKIVGNCRLKDDVEEDEHNLFLTKIHCNMAHCNNQLKRYNDVCIHCKEALAINPNHAKALYLFGVALTALGDYRLAKDRLLKADKLAPKDKNIHEALNRLEETVRTQHQKETLFWKKAFNSTEEPVKAKPKKEASIPTSPWKDQLTAFKNSTEKRIILPAGLDKDEINAVRADVEVLNLKINVEASGVCVFKD